MEPSFDVARAAVLSMDLQSGIVSIYAKDKPGLLPGAASVLKRARDRRMSVIHAQVGFRPGLPEINSRNRLLGAIKQSPEYQQLFQGVSGAIHQAVAPQGEDIVITKHRISGFTGTDLDMILRAKEIETLILFGIATSGVVLATLLDACDADYRLIVVRDCCADLDPEVHSCLLDRMFPRLATVLNSNELLEALATS